MNCLEGATEGFNRYTSLTIIIIIYACQNTWFKIHPFLDNKMIFNQCKTLTVFTVLKHGFISIHACKIFALMFRIN